MTLLKRYEYWSRDGKTFTEWFKINSHSSMEECNEYIKKHSNKKDKLKTEYKIINDIEP